MLLVAAVDPPILTLSSPFGQSAFLAECEARDDLKESAALKWFLSPSWHADEEAYYQAEAAASTALDAQAVEDAKAAGGIWAGFADDAASGQEGVEDPPADSSSSPPAPAAKKGSWFSRAAASASSSLKALPKMPLSAPAVSSPSTPLVPATEADARLTKLLKQVASRRRCRGRLVGWWVVGGEHGGVKGTSRARGAFWTHLQPQWFALRALMSSRHRSVVALRLRHNGQVKAQEAKTQRCFVAMHKLTNARIEQASAMVRETRALVPGDKVTSMAKPVCLRRWRCEGLLERLPHSHIGATPARP